MFVAVAFHWVYPHQSIPSSWRVGSSGASEFGPESGWNTGRMDNSDIISILRGLVVFGPESIGGAAGLRGMDAVLAGEHADGGQISAGGAAIAKPSALMTDAPSILGSRAERADRGSGVSPATAGPCETTATGGESEPCERCAGRERGVEHRG